MKTRQIDHHGSKYRYAGVLGIFALISSTALNAQTPAVPQFIDSPEKILVTSEDPSTYVDNPELVSGLVFAEPPVSMAVIDGESASFVVNYASPANRLSCSGTLGTWPAPAQAAFSHAADIWGGLIQSLEPIVVDACWRLDLRTGVLGSAGGRLFRDWGPASAPLAGTWYPFALADAFANTDFFPGSSDISANFSGTFSNWYFGTDGNTPAGQFDFVTVVLHELGHGIGFAGAGEVLTGGIGLTTLSGFPVIYDHFTKDGFGDSLLFDYAQGSGALGQALTGQKSGVFFHGSSAMAENGGNPVPLYSPLTWNQGSSYSHLAEIYNQTADDLMTFSIGTGVSQHTVGPVILGMLKDIGWPALSDASLTKALGGFSYDANSDNAPFDARGTLSIDFNFTNDGPDDLTNFYLLVHTANTATLNNATTSVNDGGVGSVLQLGNNQLPGSDFLFNTSETLSVPLDIDIAAGGAWQLNFSVFASDRGLARSSQAGAERIASFTLDSSMFEEQGVVLAESPDYAVAASNLNDTGTGAVLIGEGCSIGTGSRSDTMLILLVSAAMLGLFARKKIRVVKNPV